MNEHKHNWNIDQPIEDESQDLCGWSKIGQRLAESIYRLPDAEPFVISINGKWGSGKSSLLNLTIKELQKVRTSAISEADREPLIFRFEPWLFSGHEALTGIFLDQLCKFFGSKTEKAIANILKNVTSTLLAYKAAIITTTTTTNPVLGFVVGISMKILSVFQKEKVFKKTVFQKKDEVKAALKKLQRPVIIVIDDIDRLLADEIIQMFQFIKAVADFPNVVYLLAYDIDVVTKTLEEAQKGDPYEYLEKMVQITVNVPKVPFSALENFIGQELLKILGEIEFENLRASEQWAEAWHFSLKPMIKDLRSIKRFSNNLRWYHTLLREDIHICDIVLYTWVISFFPEVLEKLKQIYIPYQQLHGDIEFDENDKQFLIIKSAFSGLDENILQIIYILLPRISGVDPQKYIIPDEMKKRIAHPENLRRLLEHCSDVVDTMTPSVAEQILKQCQTVETTAKTYQKVQFDMRERWLELCHQIIYKDEYTNFIKPLTEFLFANADSIIDELRTLDSKYFSFDDLLYGVTKRNLIFLKKREENAPFELVKRVLENYETALIMPLRFVFYAGCDLNLEQPKYSPSEDKSILTADQVLELRRLIIKRINELHSNRMLYVTSTNWSLDMLYNWGEQERAKEIAKYFYTSEPGLLISFLNAHKKTFSHNGNEFTKECFGDYTDLDILIQNVNKTAKSVVWNGLGEWNQKLINSFIKCMVKN